jgi:hypothetical protein
VKSASQNGPSWRACRNNSVLSPNGLGTTASEGGPESGCGWDADMLTDADTLSDNSPHEGLIERSFGIVRRHQRQHNLSSLFSAWNCRGPSNGPRAPVPTPTSEEAPAPSWAPRHSSRRASGDFAGCRSRGLGSPRRLFQSLKECVRPPRLRNQTGRRRR